MTLHIEQAILNHLPDAQVIILDPQNDGVHLEAHVTSPIFNTLPLLKQHRVVMQALKKQFDDTSLHALALHTYTPKQWEQQLQKGVFSL